MIKIPTKVLLVDDEEDFVEMLSLRLGELGEKVTVAYSGQEGLDTLDELMYAVAYPGPSGCTGRRQILNHLGGIDP